MRPVILAFALAALGWIGWSMFQRYSPEGQAKQAEWAQVELCRDHAAEGSAEGLSQRIARCDRLEKAFRERWR